MAHSSSVSPQALRAKHCTELSYRITVPTDSFDLERFAKTIGASVESQGWDSVARSPRDPNSTDYHLHVYWRPHFRDQSKTQLQVDVHCWPPDVHAEFEYPAMHWKSKVLALPITVPYEEKGAVIEGFSISLPSEPAGVRDIWIRLGKKVLELQLYADRPLRFQGFTPLVDVEAFAGVAKTLIEEQR